MKVEINKKKFIESLSVGGSYAGNAKALPILDCVKIKVKNGSMNIISSDNENAISKRCDIISSDFEGDFCVGYKSLIQYVKLVSGENVELILNDDMSILSIKHKKGSLELPIQNADEFPISKMDKDCVEVNIDSATINNWLVDAQNYAACDELRPQLERVYLYRRDGEFGCASTNGFVLFYDHLDDDGDKFEYLIGKTAIKAICNAAKSSDSLLLKIGQSNVSIVGDGITIIARNSDLVFPNFKMILPKNSNLQVVVDRKEMIDCVSRCSIGASQTSSLIKVQIEGMTMKLSAEDIDFSVKAKEEMMVSTNGDITIGFKATFLLNILSTIQTDEVLIEMTDCSRAALFREYKNGEVSSNKTCLLMPMLLNN